MAESFKNTDVTALQAYVREYQDELMGLSLRGAPSLKYFTPYADVKGQLIITWDEIQDIVQRFAATFVGVADAYETHPATISSKAHKAEMSITPKLDWGNYRAYLTKEGVSATDWPYSRYVMEKASKKIATQKEFDQIFAGVENGGGTDAVDMFDGLLQLVADAVVATTLTEVTTGVITAGNVIANVELMDDSFDEEYREENMVMLASPSVFRLYRRAYRLAAGYHPGNPDTDAINEIVLDGSSTKMVSCPGLGASQRLILTPERNLYYAYWADENADMWEFEQNHRTIDMWCDYWFGAGFIIVDDRIIKVNDQA